MRVNPNFTDNIVNLINQAQQGVNFAAQELSTGRRVSQPSDDPAAIASMIGVNSRASAIDQYTANSDSITSVLNTGKSTLSSAITMLQRAVTLGTEGANGVLNQSNRDSIAAELSGIQTQMLSLANTSYAGQYIFAGTATDAAPYVVDPNSNQITYIGNTQRRSVQIGIGISVEMNLPGSDIFSQSGANVFDSLQSLITALKSGDNSGIVAAQAGIAKSLDAVNSSQVFYSATLNELANNDTFLSSQKLTITAYQNTLVSANTAKAATDASQAQTILTATIAAAAQLDQEVNLLNYLR